MPKPNVLLIVADQHRQDCLPAYGNLDVAAPNLDALANEGAIHTEHYCVYPICTPSRYSLLTGRYPHSHLGFDNRCTIPAGIETFPKILRRGGYRTAAVGKMHFTPTYLDAGFEKMFLAEQDGPGRFDDDYHKYLKDRNLIDAVDLFDQRAEYRKNAPEEYWDSFGALESDLPEKHHSTTWIANRALEVIDGWSGGGNLLAVGFIKPHHPFDPPGRYAAMYDADALTLLPGYTCAVPEADKKKYYFDYDRLNEKKLRHVMAMYYGTITQIDDAVGGIVAALKQKGLYDNKMIIYTADHGEYMGFHHLLLKGGHMYDPLMKIPLIVKYPGGRVRGEDGSMSSNIFLPHLILSECGADIPASMRGAGSGGCVFAEYLAGENRYMVRTRSHKLLICGNPGGETLFDLAADPYELNDVSNEPGSKKIIYDMKEMLFNEFLFDGKQSHLDADAPSVRESPRSAADEMREYMRFRSPVKA
ncbi:MAG: sulfatase-like hydrolase/transferase [Defluviitaleaceae bacterium]|nr:sulfatase-like hydrolase/transferase [Defluviitaleaceae bacterium]